jgi:hypothetical protein
MDPVGKPQLLTGETAADCLRKAPILRGWDGSDDPQDWMIVGTGRKLEAINELADIISTSSEDEVEEWSRWENRISHELVTFLRRTKFVTYKCPGCHSVV